MFHDFSTPKFEPLITSLENENHRSGSEIDIQPRLGKPTKKSRLVWLGWLDILAATITTLCFAVSAIIIDSRLPFAANVGYSNQIVAIGFLLGVMNQCLQRILPYLFLLIEARYGQSCLQNYEGILRWSPFAPKFNWLWRMLLMLLLLLPQGWRQSLSDVQYWQRGDQWGGAIEEGLRIGQDMYTYVTRSVTDITFLQ